ncbi:MAG: hypothetical protein LH624_09135 [Cryobacterium sp.]|nr:hypothetical protein [Cryobacterium sp.]
MTESWSRLRHRSLDSVSTLHQLLADESTEDRRLVLGYMETKRLLALAFEAYAVERYADTTVMEGVKRTVEESMRSGYPYAPEKYLRVRGYGQVHSRLLAYLAPRIGTDVSAAELRMLTADAVHTERRARELRDLGLRLDARESSGVDVYVLESAAPHAATGAALQLARNIKEDRTLKKDHAAELLNQLGLE